MDNTAAPPIEAVIERSLAVERATWWRGLVLLRQGVELCASAVIVIVGMNLYALSRRLPLSLAVPVLKIAVALRRHEERLLAEVRRTWS